VLEQRTLVQTELKAHFRMSSPGLGTMVLRRKNFLKSRGRICLRVSML